MSIFHHLTTLPLQPAHAHEQGQVMRGRHLINRASPQVVGGLVAKCTNMLQLKVRRAKARTEGPTALAKFLTYSLNKYRRIPKVGLRNILRSISGPAPQKSAATKWSFSVAYTRAGMGRWRFWHHQRRCFHGQQRRVNFERHTFCTNVCANFTFTVKAPIESFCCRQCASNVISIPLLDSCPHELV